MAAILCQVIRGGEQVLLLNDSSNCNVGTMIHEFLHGLGFWHEQSRCDRDNYVTILFDSIQPDQQSQFVKHCTDPFVGLGTDVDVYDEGSIMHYSSYAYGIEVPLPEGGTRVEKTILSLRGLESLMGQRDSLSPADSRTIEWMYISPPPTITGITYPGGYPSIAWNAMVATPLYDVRLYYRYSTFGSGGGQSWETAMGFHGQTTGTSIQDPYDAYTGSSSCIHYTHFPLEGWRKDFFYQVIAQYPYVNTPRATISAKVALSAYCQTPPPGP